jgi:hypothetical protein
MTWNGDGDGRYMNAYSVTLRPNAYVWFFTLSFWVEMTSSSDRDIQMIAFVNAL